MIWQAPRSVYYRSLEQGEALFAGSFPEIAAQIFSELTGAEISARKLELQTGRMPAALVRGGYKCTLGELWHNPGWKMAYLERAFLDAAGINAHLDAWGRLAADAAILWAVYGSMRREGILKKGEVLDLAFSAGDFCLGAAGELCRKMGLPVGRCICGAEEKSGLWELRNYGNLHVTAHTPEYLEWYLYLVFGKEEADRLRECRVAHRGYYLSDKQLKGFSEGLFVSVTEPGRLEVLKNALGHLPLSADGVRAYGALQDCRGAGNSVHQALVLLETRPNG